MKSPFFVVVSANSSDKAFSLFLSEVSQRTPLSSSQWLYGILEMIQPDDCSQGFILAEAQPSSDGRQLQSCMKTFLEMQDRMEAGKCVIMQVPQSEHEWAVCGFAGTT